MKAFVNVGAAGGLAYGVKVQSPEVRFERMDLFEMRWAFAEPLRQARLGRRSRIELNQRIGRQSVFSHERIFETGSFQLGASLRLRS